ncbi:MAG: EAL domain-containing protein, partial [Candidatus Thiodiazotropha taylori]
VTLFLSLTTTFAYGELSSEMADPVADLQLTSEERSWIDRNQTVRFTGDPNWLPYEAFDEEGNYIGMVADYLRVIERETGLKFDAMPVSSWTESLVSAVQGKVSVISGDAADAILNQHFNPVETYSRNPIVIIMDYRQNFVENLEEIDDRNIAIIKDYGYTADLFERYPDIGFIEVENIQEGLEGVSQGRFDALLATMALAGYHIAEMGMHNVKVVGKTSVIMDLTLFVDKDTPLLYSIINKTLKSISQTERQEIQQAWVRTKYVEKTDYGLVIQITLGLAILIMLVLGWNRQLQREIDRRHETEQSLRRSENLLKNVIDQLPDVFVLKDHKGDFLLCNQAVADLYDTEPEEMVGKSDRDFGVPAELADAMRENVLGIMEKGETEIVYEDSRDAVTGEIRNYRSIKKPLKDQDGENQILVIAQDISEVVRARNQLAESEARFRRLFESTDAIAVQGYDEERRVIYWNKASEQLYGYSEEQALGQPLEELIIPEPMRKQVITDTQAWLQGGEAIPSAELTLQRADGSKVPVFSSHVMLRGKDGAPEMYCIDVDLTQLKTAQAKIHLLSQAVEQSPVSVLITDKNGSIEYVNTTLQRISGYSAEELRGQKPSILKSNLTPKLLYKELWDAITSGRTWQGELQNRKKNGEIYWEHVYIAPVSGEAGGDFHYLAIKEDITLQKKQAEKILQQAHFDGLTSLPNRFLSLDRLGQLVKEADRNGSRVAVLFIDLDDFKKVNDSLGHEMGDTLLIQAAERLQQSIRQGDTVGRLGGDEFIIILAGLEDPLDANSVVKHLIDDFRRPFRIDNRELLLTTSVGIAVYPDDGKQPSELLRNADSAMYHSKALGRNTYSYFTDSMNRNLSQRLQLEEQLHGALERNEFTLVYQPQVAISNRQVIGVEALLRWENPKLGQVGPEDFIPVAEQTGMIVTIGEFVIREALTKAVEWRRMVSGPFTVAINLSPRQFRDPKLVPFIEQVITDLKVAPETLELEITEGVLMSGLSYVDEAVSAISKLGISIAMDDFGTGYSSLSYLRSYPFNVLKIDRSFINDITVDVTDHELVNAAIAMAHGLGLKVIAEGVETEEQFDMLALQRCDFAQGYLFSKPKKPEEISRFLKKQHEELAHESLITPV